MPEEEFETMEFKEKLEEATERAVEAAEHRSLCLLRGGDDAPFRKMERYLRNGAARARQRGIKRGQPCPATSV